MGIDLHEKRRHALGQSKHEAPVLRTKSVGDTLPIQVPDGQKDIYDSVRLTLDALAITQSEDPSLAEANLWLREQLCDYLARLRKRDLKGCYEFLTPITSSTNPEQAGWYWRHPKHDPRSALNWHGPFSSRKAAVENRLKHGPKNRLELLEADIF